MTSPEVTSGHSTTGLNYFSVSNWFIGHLCAFKSRKGRSQIDVNKDELTMDISLQITF
jgi:hypothetical protein